MQQHAWLSNSFPSHLVDRDGRLDNHTTDDLSLVGGFCNICGGGQTSRFWYLRQKGDKLQLEQKTNPNAFAEPGSSLCHQSSLFLSLATLVSYYFIYCTGLLFCFFYGRLALKVDYTETEYK